MSEAPYGSWASAVTTDLVVDGAVSIGEVRVDGEEVWWSEARPEEGGRVQLVRRTADGRTTEALPEGFSARTRVHEYGGGAWMPRDGAVIFSNFADQRLWVVTPGREPEPLTAEPPSPAGVRFADMAIDGAGLVAVRETHGDGEPRNEIVAIDGGGAQQTIVRGPDFVASPRPGPGGALAWLQWDHPNMPWDAAELWVTDRRVAGGDGESIFQPAWSPEGVLHAVSDRSDWWNLYRVTGELEPVAPIEGEVGVPQWVFGQSRYAFLSDGRVVCAYAQGGTDHLAAVRDGELRRLDVPFTEIASVQAWGDRVVMIAASPTRDAAVVAVDVDTGSVEALRPARDLGLDDGWWSLPQPIEFPTGDGERAHALWYPPTNPDVEGPDGERPPLLVTIHGGPTSAARPRLDLVRQFWTSRGFGVVDVNYRGSTGFGRPYRDRLQGSWGRADVEDCVAAARWLAERGLVDGERLAIRGGSAGGYTVLCALAFHDVFTAGADFYGVADLAALATDTHKFESRYLDGLVGPWPEAEGTYRERSPIHHVDRLSAPLIVFQGLEDEVVPPSQSEMIVDALRAKGVPVRYFTFEGEQHGFRRAETIVRTLEEELAFYGEVFGFPVG